MNGINKIFTSIGINIYTDTKMFIPYNNERSIIYIFYNYIGDFFTKFFFISCCYGGYRYLRLTI
nr:MAG TPA: hypothetical protein [Caudoviricetes sp.]